jgi:hypothetical protein
MQENKNLVEEALIQMKNVEEAITENAKGILASTMKEEIGQLVKESLSEQDEIDVDAEVDDVDIENDADNEIEVDSDSSIEDIETGVPSDDMGMDMDMEDSMGDMSLDEPIDLSDIEDDDFLLKVFKSMDEEDGIIIKKDDNDVHLVDNNSDVEYLIKLGESMEENYESMEYNEEMSDDQTQLVIDKIFSTKNNDFNSDKYETEEDEIVYEIEFTEDSDSDIDEEMEEEMDEEMEEEMDEEMYDVHEAYSHKKSKKSETKEGKMSVKPKGVGIGKAKFSYKKTSGGFDEDKKEGPKTMGTGKPKFEYKKGENMGGTNKVVKKTETKEAARTYAFGSKDKSRGLRKGVTPNRNLAFESLEAEVSSLREKNEEYRKALNIFREKLNEVAIFNSNLAYATRLFTEHSTTKKEKINILRRFDTVESLRESKGLYKTIKEELNKTETKSLTESVNTKLNKTVQTGSSTTLIESKTYEAPQFLRIKDLMSKIS